MADDLTIEGEADFATVIADEIRKAQNYDQTELAGKRSSATNYMRGDMPDLPHDGEARELQTGKSRQQFLEERGFSVSIVPRHEPMDGIDAARVRFNRMWFDALACDRGIECLRMYQAEYDDKRQVLRSRPLHNWASHGADAFRCGVMGAEETVRHDMPQVENDWVR